MNYQEVYENEQRRLGEAEEKLKKAEEKLKKAEEEAEKAEEEAEEAKNFLYRRTTLPEFLAEYHAKFQSVETGTGGLASGEASKPFGSRYPKLITPWNDFASQQQKIWKTIRASSTYPDRIFPPSSMNKASLEDVILNVRSKKDLVVNDNLLVIRPVDEILILLYKDKELREQLKLEERVEFRSNIWHVLNPTCPNDVRAQTDAIFLSGPNWIRRHQYSIDYPPLFKFSATDIVQGLEREIFPDQEVNNNKDGDEDPDYDSRRLVTVVISPLYSYLLRACICYGYINLGDMMIFLHILDDPGHVECHVWNPRDFDFNHSGFIHNTAIGEVIAFSIQALNSDRQTQAWSDAASRLELWPPKEDVGVSKKGEDSEDVESGKAPIRLSDYTERSIVSGAGKEEKSDGDKTAGKRVREREYCSISCLLGLSQGGDLDLDCPNIVDHGKRHLAQHEFLGLVREQLARDRGRVTDCEPLWMNGARGETFKVTLSSHGYTVIAKGVQFHDIPHLKNEAKIYKHLGPLQGIHIPVCLGAINLILPYYHKSGEFVRFLFQSYGGVPVSHIIDEKNYKGILEKINHALEAIHQLNVLHCDPMPHNFLIDEKSGVLQVIDFERARIYDDEQQSREGTNMTRKEFLFNQELRIAYGETFLKIR